MIFYFTFRKCCSRMILKIFLIAHGKLMNLCLLYGLLVDFFNCLLLVLLYAHVERLIGFLYAGYFYSFLLSVVQK